jgi:hypothetical protein
MTTLSAQACEDLLALAALLESLPLGRFDYSEWVGMEWEGKPDLSCGTTACALGWATTIPSLAARGLRLQETCDGGSIEYGKWFGFDAAARFFQISWVEARYLFAPGAADPDPAEGVYNSYSPDKYASARAVAIHIRRFVADRSPV